MDYPVLQIIVGSTRPARVGDQIARWLRSVAVDHGGFSIDFADLAELNLPLMDEPRHPKLGEYVHAHTVEWSERVMAADAIVLVTPEYNHGLTAPVKNAFDYLHREWQYKPIGFVSYGGVSGGTRAVQMLKQVVVSLRLTPVLGAVTIPSVAQHIDERGQFIAPDNARRAAVAMLDDLIQMEIALRPLRHSRRS